MRCDHEWIYEGVTNIECTHPGCRNFDPKMHRYNLAVGDHERCMGWGVAWYLLSNIALYKVKRFISPLLYDVKPIRIRSLNRDNWESMCEKHDRGIHEIFLNEGVEWDEETTKLIDGYILKAVAIGREKCAHGSR